MPKAKYRNTSGRVVAGVKPGGVITRFPKGTNVRALELAGMVALVRPAAPDKEGGVNDGDTGTD